MSKQTINLGTTDNDGTGTTLKAAGEMINDNFDEVYAKDAAQDLLIAGFADQVGPTTVTLAGVQTLTNKTLTAPYIVAPTGIVKADVGLGNVKNVDTTNASNLTSGKISSALLPPIEVGGAYVADSEIEMLALTTIEGDVVIRSDESKSYIRNSGTTGTMADYYELLIPAGTVVSVNSKTGAVSLSTADISDTTDKRYITDALLAAIANTSGSNTGDNAANSNYDDLPGRVETIETTLSENGQLIDAIADLPFVMMPTQTTVLLNSLTEVTEGTLVYDSTLHTFKFWNGSAWKTIQTN